MQQDERRVFVWGSEARRKKIRIQSYTHIRGYHACRPVDVSSYYMNGIVAYAQNELEQKFVERFGVVPGFKQGGWPKQRLIEERRIYFSLIKSILFKGAGHYLCYGSEYFSGIAAHLDKGIAGPVHKMLLRSGIPTIFACDIPIGIIHGRTLEDINKYYSQNCEDFSVYIYNNLPPEYLVSQEHPRKLFDPLRGFVHVNDQVTCPLC